jgi:hypothetical protein
LSDLIPPDVVSSAGGATGDLWDEAWDDGRPSPDTEAPAPGSEPARATAAAAVQRGTSEPKRQPPTSRPRRKAAAGAPRAFSAGSVASDTPQGKAFAEVVELFPGRVVEVRPLRRGGDDDDQKGGGDETEPTFAAGYDDPIEAGSEADEA